MDEARLKLHEHAEAINARDFDDYCATVHFPFTYQSYDGIALTFADEHDAVLRATLPWDNILRTDPDWSHTEYSEISEVARSAASAVYKVRFNRVDTAGNSSDSYEAIWILTCIDGVWGVQFRHNLGQVG